MLFISLLIAATMAIAGAAAYFSVYGLAYTFSGVFWSVVVMGASLEAGKLVAASYLYRYWNKTNLALKSYLMFGVLALMVLTSTGIFGYLSAGYQQDVLPLKQKQEQIALLEDEKARALARKKQIDDLLAGGPTVTNVNRTDGNVDPNAARALRETTRARESLVRQYRAEQESVTKRVADLDAQLLTLKQEVIKVEAHIGPITYIAKAFDLQTDDATKYLVFLIIFAFDPMAVALTLAVNIALRLRKEEQEAAALANAPAPFTPPAPMPPAPAPVPEPVVQPPSPEPQPPIFEELTPTPRPVEREADLVPEPEPDPILVQQEPTDPAPEPETVIDQPPPAPEPIAEPVIEQIVVAPEPALEVAEPPAAEPTPEPVRSTGTQRRPRAYADLWNDGNHTGDKLRELINHHRWLKAKQDNGEQLSRDELWELRSIEAILRKNGVDIYL